VAPSFTEYSNRFVFTNSDGNWTVYKNYATFTGGKFVGPGYIAKFVRPDGKVIVDDTVNTIYNINDPKTGGLGCFGWQHARANGEAEVYNRTWDITGRLVSSGGNGIVSSNVKVAPYLSADKLSVRGSFEVIFRDGYNPTMMKVRYDYLVEDSNVKQWVTVTQDWNGSGFPAFVKEPKIACSVSPNVANNIIFNKLDVFNSASSTLRSQIDLPSIGDPTVNTIQLGQDSRVRVRFYDGTHYFNIVAEANSPLTYNALTQRVTDYGTRSVWEGSTVGMDKWAQVSNTRKVFENTGGAYCLQGPGSPATLTRQWEVTRRVAGPEADVMFHAWEGGSGYPDCLKCSRAFGPQGEKYSSYMCYSYDVGWVL